MPSQLVYAAQTLRSSVRRYSSKALNVGERLEGYRVQQIRRVPELELTAIALEHEKTGAQHLHVDRDDTNNVFVVGFGTPVTDSTGVPHVLEHTTLCGSKKYPVRDPFFKMLNRSLANFMNAFTASDYTIYPFATTNAVDYEHLRSVYMDAVFQPRLNKLDFLQEGWRLEHEDPNDTTSSLQFKGIVYNEMKGQTSDANYLFYIQSHQAMFPGTTYEHASGGNPANITDLTYDQLLQFHKTRYHPSNSYFYTYGSFGLENHLSSIAKILNQYDRITVPQAEKIVQPWTSPRTVTTTCALDPLSPADKQCRISLSFLANDTRDSFETFSMHLLAYLLLDGHASPMHKALIDTNLGSEFSVNTGYDNSTRMGNLSVGLQGVQESDLQTVQQRVVEVLKQAQREGFDPKRIEAAIHQMELGRKHKTANFGVSIMHNITSGWFNGVDPIEQLQVNKHIERLNNELSQGGFFESRIDRYLLDNPHTLTFIMKPESTYAAGLVEEEKQRLSTKISQLTDEDKTKIAEQGKALLTNQEKTEDLSLLPTLSLHDISPKMKRTILEHTGLINTPVQWRTTATNGITYFRAISTLPPIPDDLKMYLPLFCDALFSLGTKNQSMAEIDEEIRLYTGGLRASTTVSTNHSDIDVTDEGIVLAGNCLDRNIDKMYDIFSKIVHETNFDNIEKLKTLILGNASATVNMIANAGHSYAHTYASSSLSPAMRTSELLGGMTQVDFIRRLAAETDFTTTVAKLKQIAAIVLRQPSLRVAVTCGDDTVSNNEKELIRFISSLPGSSPTAEEGVVEVGSVEAFVPRSSKTFFPLPFSVNFTAKAFRGVPYTHPDGAKLQVLSSLMTNHYLHREIREKQGAYGGGSRYAGLNGLFSFYSYRDPRMLETLSTYETALRWMDERRFSDQEMTEAKLSIFQSVDAPQSVSEEGMLQFVNGVSDQMRQQRRDELLDVTQLDVKDAAERYLNSECMSSIAVLGDAAKVPLSQDGWDVRQWEPLET